MSVRSVLKMGEPLLLRVAAEVTRFDAELQQLVADMDDTMRALSGAGIAAPQIGVSARVVQHEVDHLDGILFPQRVRDLRDFGFEDALAGRMTPMPD